MLAVSVSFTVPLLSDNVMLFHANKRLFVSFHDAWWVRISITAQYTSIYVVIEQLMMLAFPLVFL